MSEPDNAENAVTSDGPDEESANMKVHSANAWENADLGDSDRKNKFLRLMGAGKKEHHGRFIIGDHKPDHGRSADDTEQLQHKLEDQYEQSMQHRLAGGRRGHIGLGYHDADKDPKPESEDSEVKDKDSEEKSSDLTTEKKGDDVEKKDKVEEEPADKPDRKRESTDGHVAEDAPDAKKMKFVKSSS